jgi:hypothetical protein
LCVDERDGLEFRNLGLARTGGFSPLRLFHRCGEKPPVRARPNGVLLDKELIRPVMGKVYVAELAEVLPQCTLSKSCTFLKQLTIAIVL